MTSRAISTTLIILFALLSWPAPRASARQGEGAGETKATEEEARRLAKEFSRRFRETNDLAPLVEEFFVADFARRLCREPEEGEGDNFPLEIVGPEACSRATDAELRRFYVASFNFSALTVEYLLAHREELERAHSGGGSAPGEGPEPKDVFPPEVSAILKDEIVGWLADPGRYDGPDDEEPEGPDAETRAREAGIRTIETLRSATAQLERASALLRPHLPPLTDLYKEHGATRDGADVVIYCPRVAPLRQEQYGFAAGTQSAGVDVQQLLLLQLRMSLVRIDGELKVLSVLPVFDGDGGC